MKRRDLLLAAAASPFAANCAPLAEPLRTAFVRLEWTDQNGVSHEEEFPVQFAKGSFVKVTSPHIPEGSTVHRGWISF